MPVADKKIVLRSYLDLARVVIPDDNGAKTKVEFELVCTACNRTMSANEDKILVCGLFRCCTCFQKLVRLQPHSFGVDAYVTDAEIDALLEPSDEVPGALNLKKPKTGPRFLLFDQEPTA